MATRMEISDPISLRSEMKPRLQRAQARALKWASPVDSWNKNLHNCPCFFAFFFYRQMMSVFEDDAAAEKLVQHVDITGK